MNEFNNITLKAFPVIRGMNPNDPCAGFLQAVLSNMKVIHKQVVYAMGNKSNLIQLLRNYKSPDTYVDKLIRKLVSELSHRKVKTIYVDFFRRHHELIEYMKRYHDIVFALNAYKESYLDSDSIIRNIEMRYESLKAVKLKNKDYERLKRMYSMTKTFVIKAIEEITKLMSTIIGELKTIKIYGTEIVKETDTSLLSADNREIINTFKFLLITNDELIRRFEQSTNSFYFRDLYSKFNKLSSTFEIQYYAFDPTFKFDSKLTTSLERLYRNYNVIVRNLDMNQKNLKNLPTLIQAKNQKDRILAERKKKQRELELALLNEQLNTTKIYVENQLESTITTNSNVLKMLASLSRQKVENVHAAVDQLRRKLKASKYIENLDTVRQISREFNRAKVESKYFNRYLKLVREYIKSVTEEYGKKGKQELKRFDSKIAKSFQKLTKVSAKINKEIDTLADTITVSTDPVDAIVSGDTVLSELDSRIQQVYPDFTTDSMNKLSGGMISISTMGAANPAVTNMSISQTIGNGSLVQSATIQIGSQPVSWANPFILKDLLKSSHKRSYIDKSYNIFSNMLSELKEHESKRKTEIKRINKRIQDAMAKIDSDRRLTPDQQLRKKFELEKLRNSMLSKIGGTSDGYRTKAILIETTMSKIILNYGRHTLDVFFGIMYNLVEEQFRGAFKNPDPNTPLFYKFMDIPMMIGFYKFLDHCSYAIREVSKRMLMATSVVDSNAKLNIYANAFSALHTQLSDLRVIRGVYGANEHIDIKTISIPNTYHEWDGTLITLPNEHAITLNGVVTYTNPTIANTSGIAVVHKRFASLFDSDDILMLKNVNTFEQINDDALSFGGRGTYAKFIYVNNTYYLPVFADVLNNGKIDSKGDYIMVQVDYENYKTYETLIFILTYDIETELYRWFAESSIYNNFLYYLNVFGKVDTRLRQVPEWSHKINPGYRDEIIQEDFFKKKINELDPSSSFNVVYNSKVNLQYIRAFSKCIIVDNFVNTFKYNWFTTIRTNVGVVDTDVNRSATDNTARACNDIGITNLTRYPYNRTTFRVPNINNIEAAKNSSIYRFIKINSIIDPKKSSEERVRILKDVLYVFYKVVFKNKFHRDAYTNICTILDQDDLESTSLFGGSVSYDSANHRIVAGRVSESLGRLITDGQLFTTPMDLYSVASVNGDVRIDYSNMSSSEFRKRIFTQLVFMIDDGKWFDDVIALMKSYLYRPASIDTTTPENTILQSFSMGDSIDAGLVSKPFIRNLKTKGDVLSRLSDYILKFKHVRDITAIYLPLYMMEIYSSAIDPAQDH